MWKSAVLVAGVARSGTSWVGQILNSSEYVRFRFQPLFSYEFKNQVNEDSSPAEFRQFLDGLWATESDFLSQRDKIDLGDYPNFRKVDAAHTLVLKENRYQTVIEPMLRKVPELKLIGVIRNPCAVINSWRHNEKEFPAEAILRDEWRFGNCKNEGNQDYFGYYKWKEVANLYLDLQDQMPDRVRVVSYENLVENRAEEASEMFEYVGLQLGEQTRAFLEESSRARSDSYYSVFKDSAVAGKWRAELDAYIVSEIQADVRDTRLEQFFR